jgi:TrpR family trp operon transcriptional repressor
LRWTLLELLAGGVPQRKIAEDLQISLCKITRGSKIMKQRGAVTARVLRERRTKE